MNDIFKWRDAVLYPVISREMNPRWMLDELEKRLTRAIEKCSMACIKSNGGKICTTLSGGLDSSFCLAKIREIFGDSMEIHTSTIGGSENYPDIKFAKQVSERFGTIHHQFIPSADEIQAAKKEMEGICPDKQRGDVAVFSLYKEISSLGFKSVIAHDGIDELLGGYWEHRDCEMLSDKESAFRYFWSRLKPDHLLPLEKKAAHFGIEVLLPYLQWEVVDYISKIPLNDRTSASVSKMPLRSIAEKYLPIEIINRNKKGFCSALDKE